MKSDRLGTESPLKLLVEFSVPAIIGMVVNAVYNIVDRIFIGNDPGTGALGLAAISITYPVTLVLLALCLMIGVGGATRFSISMGLKKEKDAAYYMGNALLLGLVFASVFAVFGNLFLEPLLTFLGASQQVMPFAKEYLTIILFGSVFQVISMFGNNFSRAQGNPKNAMVSQLIGAGFNIVFDFIFIVLLGWGMKGAAIATVGGMFLSSVWQLAFICSKKSIIPLRFDLMKPQLRFVKDIIVTGMPVFFMQMANSVLNIILNGTLARYGGDVAISAVGIITSFQTLLLMPITGIVQGQQTIISYNFGYKRMDRALQTLKYAAIGATIITLIGFIIVQGFTERIISMFNSDPEVVGLAIRAIRIWFFALPVVGAQVIFASYFQAIGKAKIASLLSLMRQIIFLVPLIFILSKLFDLVGIFYAVPLADFSAFIVTLLFLRAETRKKSGGIM